MDAAALFDRVDVLRDGFTEAMDDDFNAPAALGEIFSFVSDVESRSWPMRKTLAPKRPPPCERPATPLSSSWTCSASTWRPPR
ncbi:MAG: DALR domain-containing protein [Adlercreutzia equolifaciens]